MQAVLDSLDAVGGLYVGLFLFAMLSGVIFLASCEAALIALATASSFGWPKLVALALIVAAGQSTTHALLYKAARRVADRPSRLEARIAKARALGERWKKSELALVVLGATVGVPPQALVAVFAGVIGIRFRTFMAISVSGRIVRFVTIVLVAHLF